MEISVINTGVYGVNSLVIPVGDNKCFVVDPAGSPLTSDETKITDYIKSKKWECVEIVLTHSHFDHITGIVAIRKCFPDAKIAIHEDDFSEMQNPPGPCGKAMLDRIGSIELADEVAKQPNADIALKDGDNVFGWKVIHTPGHTKGSMCLYNEKENILISGDTIFDYGSYGRTDMPGGSQSDMESSLKRLKETVPAGTLVYPGHENYGFPFNPDLYCQLGCQREKSPAFMKAASTKVFSTVKIAKPAGCPPRGLTQLPGFINLKSFS